MILRGSTVTAPLQGRARVVVVGTGAGGALVASRIAEAGFDVWMIEAGPHVTSAEMNQLERDMMPKLYFDAGLRQSEDSSIVVLHGRAVGGSTVVNYLDCFRTPDRLLRSWASSRSLPEVSPERMHTRFREIEGVMHVEKMDPGMLNPNNRKLKEGAEQLGWKGDLFHRNADRCYGSGFCDLGCAYNAKQSAAITWVPKATNAGATLLCECRVDRVLLEGDRAIGVEGTLLDADRRPRGTATVFADLVVIAGGAIETPHLLLRSGVEDPSGQLGKNLYLHPSTAVVGIFPERIAMWEGVKQGYYVSEFSWVLEEHPTDVLLEGVGGPPGLVSTLMSGWGEARRASFADLLPHLAGTGVLLRDHDPGWVEAGPGRPKVHYTLSSGDTQRLRDGMARTAEAYFAAGASEVATSHAPALRIRHPGDVLDIWNVGCGPGQLNLFTFHQMGTARMGGRPDRDVVDPMGRMWRYRNLHVADSSVFPTASGVNPQMTVYGLAHLIGDGILDALHRMPPVVSVPSGR